MARSSEQQEGLLLMFATLMPDGTPQVTPVWIDYVNGEKYW